MICLPWPSSFWTALRKDCTGWIAARVSKHGIWPLLLLVLFAAIGGGIGATMAIRWPMTGMPQMVALLNGFGGAASMLVAAAELTSTRAIARFGDGTSKAIAVTSLEPWTQFAIAIGLACFIGSVTLTGSLVAFGKLHELPQFKKPWDNPNRQWISLALALAALFLLCCALCVGSIVRAVSEAVAWAVAVAV